MRMLAMVLLAGSLMACGSSSGDQKETAGSDAKPAGSEKAAKDGDDGGDEAGSGEQKIEQLGLTATLPEMSNVSDGLGGKGVMIMGTAPVTIEEADDDTPKTLEAAKKDVEMFDPQNIKEEKLDDGWVMTFENTGSAGTNYWMKTFRKIGDKEYACDTSVMSDDQRKAAIDVCKSLKKS